MLGGRSRRSPGSGATAVRITAILAAVGCCLAAAAYAAVGSAPPSSGWSAHSPLRPRIVGHPAAVTSSTTATFVLAQPGRPVRRGRPLSPLRMECEIDSGPWQPCATPVVLTGVGRGTHRFAVHTVNRAGAESPAAEFEWRRVREVAGPQEIPALIPRVREGRTSSDAGRTPAHEPLVEEASVEEVEASPEGPPFALRQVGALDELLPGAPAQTIAVLIENPNRESITVTSVTASIVSDPPGCPASENFVLAPAEVTPDAPVVVAGESAISLPAAGIAGPTIAMADLPTDQDGCQGDELDIALSGEAGE